MLVILSETLRNIKNHQTTGEDIMETRFGKFLDMALGLFIVGLALAASTHCFIISGFIKAFF